jgi:uncharacterized protein with ParB-like and HNH nuclease domain
LKADPISVGKVLSENHRFVVPIYQRTFAWTEKRQLEPLFAQIEAKAQERIQNGKVEFPHYMGSLLVIPEGEAAFGRIQAFDIVDGQQRLTTFHICFAALREIARVRGYEDLSKKLEGLLLHTEETVESDKKYGRYKLQPTSFDREYFRDLIDLSQDQIKAKYPALFHKNGKLIKGTAPTAVAAYWFFYKRANEFLAVDDAQARNRFLALTDAIFQNFHFIVITLSKEDDPQVIFATLNTGGEPLAAMDLVRNDVFLRAIRKGEDEESLMKKYWQTFEHSFWKAEHTQGRLKKPLMDFFLAHTLAAETGELISLTELYAEYRKFAKRSEGQSIAQELASITKYAPVYRELVDPDKNSSLFKLSSRLSTFDLSTAYPLILLVATSTESDETKDALYKLIGSYIIRRALCGLTAKNYNIAFLDFVSHMRTHGVSVESFAAVTELRKNSEAARFPTDDDLKKAVSDRDQYYSLPSHRLRLIIEELEIASRDKFSASDGIRTGLSIEHIMPQHWQEHWRTLPSGREAPLQGGVPLDEPMAMEMNERNRIINTLGNLSLLTQPGNSSAGNANFESKKPRLKGALLRMNLDIANEPSWSETQIKDRAKKLATYAVQIWPSPPCPN